MKIKVLNRVLKSKEVDPSILNQFMEVGDERINFNLRNLRNHLESELKLDIDLDVNQCLFCAWEPEKDHVANGVMGANPGNITLRKIIYHKLPKRVQSLGLEKPYLSVGPFLLDLVRKDIVVLPDFYFYPVYWQKNYRKKIWLTQKEREEIRKDCYMYQFGYTTNRLGNKVTERMKNIEKQKRLAITETNIEIEENNVKKNKQKPKGFLKSGIKLKKKPPKNQKINLTYNRKK